MLRTRGPRLVGPDASEVPCREDDCDRTRGDFAFACGDACGGVQDPEHEATSDASACRSCPT